LPVPILVENEHLQIWQLLTVLLAFLELFVTIWVAVIGSFLTIASILKCLIKQTLSNLQIWWHSTTHWYKIEPIWMTS
jgi:hypothetical protein